MRFALVGGFNTALDFVLLFALIYQLSVNPYLANLISTGICLVISFTLNRQWTFQSQGDKRRQFVLFLAVTLAGLWIVQSVLMWLVISVFSRWFEGALLIAGAKAVATLGSLTWNYLLYQKVVFPSNT